MPHLAHILDNLPGDFPGLGITALSHEPVSYRLLLIRREELVGLRILGEVR